LTLFDEIRLFYVASSRAKANLIFTASPGEDNVTTSYLSGAGLEPGRPRLKKEDELLLAALNKKYDEDPNVLKTAEALRGLVSEVVLTPTKLNNYLKCRRKFFYDDILKLPGKKRQGLVFGNCAHKALEETYSHFKKEGSFPDFALFEESFKRELRFQGVDEAMENRCLDKLTVLEEWFRRASAGPVKPLDLEKKISINMGEGLLFVGKYDKVEFENAQKGLVRVMDYKTGRPDDRLKEIINFSGILDDDERHDYIRQLVSYKMLFEEDKNGPKKYSVSHGTLVFLEPVSADAPRYGLKKGSYRDGTIELTAGMVSDLKRTIKNTWKSIQDLSFNKLPEREEPKCGRCDFDKICWQK
jgi:CRISPR/Cas system-associated exonuclease Cas4 (RecB family)